VRAAVWSGRIGSGAPAPVEDSASTACGARGKIEKKKEKKRREGVAEKWEN